MQLKPLTEQRSKKTLKDSDSKNSLIENVLTISRDETVRNVLSLVTHHGKKEKGSETNRTKKDQKVDGMINAKKPLRANISVVSKSSGKTNQKGDVSTNMVYEYNKGQILAKEESFHKNLDEVEMSGID